MADNSTPTVNFDKNDYTFGKVGETKYIYINNDKFTITKDTSTATGPVSNTNVFTKSFHCWRGSRGVYDNSFPYAERANGENTSKILNGWYFNNWAGIGTDQTNDPSYNVAKNSEWGKTNLEKWPMTANTWETIDANYIEPFCRFKFSIQDMLPDGLSLDNIDVKKISGYILIQQENCNIDNSYQAVRVLSRQTTDENGWYWQGTECLFYWAQSYSSNTEYPSETVNFEAHIIEGQTNLFIDIAAICPKTGDANMTGGGANNNSLKFEFVCQTIEYADKFNGDIYTAPNTDMVYISAAGANITNVAALNGNVNRVNDTNKVILGNDVVLTTLKVDSTYITIDWLAGKIIGSSGSSKDFTINSSAEQEINNWLQIYSDVRAIEIIGNGPSKSYTIEIENTRSSSTVINSINSSLAEIQNEIKDVKENKIKWQQILYRKGDIITTTDSDLNPATRYGGTWKLLTSGIPSILLKSYTENTKWARFYSDGTLMQGDTIFVGTGDIQNTLVKFPFKFANTEYSLTASPSDVDKDEFKDNYKYSINTTTNGAELGWGPRTTDSIYFGLDGGYWNDAQWISYTAIGKFNPGDDQSTKDLIINTEVEYHWKKIDNVANGDGFSTPLTVENVTYKVSETVLPVGGIKWEMSCKEEDMLEKGFVPCSGKKIKDLEGIHPRYDKDNLAMALYGSSSTEDTLRPIPDGANNILLGDVLEDTQLGSNQWYEIYWGGKLVQSGRVDNINSNSNFECKFIKSYDHTNYTPHITFLHTNSANTPDLNEYGYIKELRNASLYCYQSNVDKGWSCLWTTTGTLNNTDQGLIQARKASPALIPYIKVFLLADEVELVNQNQIHNS